MYPVYMIRVCLYFWNSLFLQDILADAGFLYDKATVHSGTINARLCTWSLCETMS